VKKTKSVDTWTEIQTKAMGKRTGNSVVVEHGSSVIQKAFLYVLGRQLLWISLIYSSKGRKVGQVGQQNIVRALAFGLKRPYFV
jgi:hypothetical protein